MRYVLMGLLVGLLGSASASRTLAAEPGSASGKPAKAPERYRVLVLDLESSEVDASTRRTIGSVVAAGLAQYPMLDVLSGDDVRRMVQLEGEKATMGCKDDASCLADIADAMGAQLVVFGNVGRLSKVLVVSMNLLDAAHVRSVGRAIVKAPDLDELPNKLTPELRKLVGPYLTQQGFALPPLEDEGPIGTAPVVAKGDPGAWPWVLATTGGSLFVLGGALAGVGLVPFIGYQTERANLVALDAKFQASGDTALIAQASESQGRLFDAQSAWNQWGVIGVDVGAPLAAVGVALFAGGIVWGLQATPDESDAPATPTYRARTASAGAAR